MMARYPEKRIIAALRTGWHDKSFVLILSGLLEPKPSGFKASSMPHITILSSQDLADGKT